GATCLAGLVMVLVAGATAVRAEQPSYAELAERLAQVESQLEAQSIGLMSYHHVDGAAGSGCSDCDYGAPQGGHFACSTGCGCAPGRLHGDLRVENDFFHVGIIPAG